MYKENSFHSIKFSTDHGYATSLDMTVYSWKEDIENGKSIMQIEFRPIEYGKDYDIVHNPDKYVLCPAKWFNNNFESPLIASQWVRIDREGNIVNE